MADFMLRRFFATKEREHQKVLFEITIRKIADDFVKLIIDCSNSIPKDIHVIPWHTLVIERELPPDEELFTQLVILDHENKTKFLAKIDKFQQMGNCRALLVLLAAESQSLMDLSCRIPIVFIPSKYTSRLKSFVGSHKSRQLQVSCIPLCAAEIKEKSQEFSLICLSERLYCKLITQVRDCICNGEAMSTSTFTMEGDQPQHQRTLFFISELCPQIIDQASMELVNIFSTSDHSLLITILTKREDFLKHFSKDFPVYIVFGHMLRIDTSLHGESKANDKLISDMFQGFKSQGIKQGLEDFIELPDFVIRKKGLIGSSTSIKCFIAEELIELLKHYIFLSMSQPFPPVVEILVAVSIAIRLHLSSNENIEKCDKFWTEHFVNNFKSKLFTMDFLEDLKTGLLSISLILEAFGHYMLGWEELYAVMSTHVYSPALIQSVIKTGLPYLIRADNGYPLLRHFLNPMADQIQTYISRHGPQSYFKGLENSLFNVLKEEFELIEYLNKLAAVLQGVEEGMNRFLDIFVTLLDFSDRNVIDYIHTITQTKSEAPYRAALVRKIGSKFEELSSQLKMKDFILLYQAGDMKNVKLIEDYMQTKLPGSLLDEGVIKFIELCSKSGTNSKKLEAFLFSIIESYGPSKQNFIKDLVHLNFENYVFHSMEDILNLVEADNLVTAVPDICCEIMNHLPEESQFHWRLIIHLVKGFTLHLKKDINCTSCTTVLEKCYSVLKRELSSNHLANPPHDLPVFKVLKAVVDVLFEFGSISWFKQHGETVHQLVRVYYILCKGENTADFSLLNEIPTQLIHQNTDAPIFDACVQTVDSEIHTDELLEGIQAKNYVYILIELRRTLRECLERNQTSDSTMKQTADTEITNERHSIEQCSSDGKASVQQRADKIYTDQLMKSVKLDRSTPAVDIGNSNIDSSALQSPVMDYKEQLKVDHQAYMYLKMVTRKLHQTQDELHQTQEELHRTQEELQQNQRFLLQKQHDEEVQKNTIEHQQKQLHRLQDQITAFEGNWRVSHNEVTLTQHELGRGGWGVIWIGQFREQKVAVKQMHETINSQANLDLLHREINTMAQLRHPNLLQFIGAVLDHPSGTPMIITEIMDMPLRKAYEDGLLAPTESCLPVCLGIMRDVAVGLNYLHCLPDPIIHRDVSSANVLLESKGINKWKTKISDFGSANKAKQAMTRAMGTFVYSAPESMQAVSATAAKETLTTKMDVFSYGVLLCELLTCEFPTEEFFPEMLHRVELRSRELCKLIVIAIETNPTERPTMKQVIEQIDSYIHVHRVH